jgi:transcriptional antiterminator RfaH
MVTIGRSPFLGRPAVVSGYLPAKQRVRLRLEFLGRQLNIEVSEREVIKECRYPLAALRASL